MLAYPLVTGELVKQSTNFFVSFYVSILLLAHSKSMPEAPESLIDYTQNIKALKPSKILTDDVVVVVYQEHSAAFWLHIIVDSLEFAVRS